ncbi:hypothetical protein RJ639_038179 [Escallonia herrerae]|uniref:Uncharacterized protein n=1 Tax=Escallonia herrerae TaxID=1293975 RepID=A0AA88WLF2_9ASTE|nr:hypothetical protein RJ639_038179 [Escallonia herrerae]
MLSEPVITSDLGTKGKRCMPFGDALKSDTTNEEKRETPQTSMDVMKRMPTVTTTGGIPCGKKIEGDGGAVDLKVDLAREQKSSHCLDGIH